MTLAFHSQECLCCSLTAEQLLALLPMCTLFNRSCQEITYSTLKQNSNYLANVACLAMQQGSASQYQAATHALRSSSGPAALPPCALDNEIITTPFVLINVATEQFACVLC